MKETESSGENPTSESEVEREARQTQVVADLTRGIFPPPDAPAPVRRLRLPGQAIPRVNPPYRV